MEMSKSERKKATVGRTGRGSRKNGQRGEWRYNNWGSSLSTQGIFKVEPLRDTTCPGTTPPLLLWAAVIATVNVLRTKSLRLPTQGLDTYSASAGCSLKSQAGRRQWEETWQLLHWAWCLRASQVM